jgi:hypothetical protein
LPHVGGGALQSAEHDAVALGSLPEPFKSYWTKSRAETFAAASGVAN